MEDFHGGQKGKIAVLIVPSSRTRNVWKGVACTAVLAWLGIFLSRVEITSNGMQPDRSSRYLASCL